MGIFYYYLCSCKLLILMKKAMKKLTYLLAAAAVFTACNSGNNGYTVTGTIEGATDGDTVYLQTRSRWISVRSRPALSS